MVDRFIKTATKIIFSTSFLMHAFALILIMKSADNTFLRSNLDFPVILSGLFSFAWIAISIFVLVLTYTRTEWTGIGIELAVLVAFSSFMLITLNCLPRWLVIISSIFSIFAVATFKKHAKAVVINTIASAANSLILYIQEDIFISIITLLIFFLLVAFTFLGTRNLIEWHKQMELFDQARWAATELAHQNIRLQNTMIDTEMWIRIRERTRLAREIHDTVGYALTAIHVQLSAMKELLKVEPLSLESRITQLEELVQITVQEVQNEVAILRDEEIETWPTKWHNLCNMFSDFTGIKINIDIVENLDFINDTLGVVITRIIQEGLTNAYRHGKANYVDIAMRWKDKEKNILLRISDNGNGSDEIKKGSGLKGIITRVESLGGNVDWNTKHGKGFDLGIVLPCKDGRLL